MQLLSSLFKVYWKWKYADIICYKLTLLVFLLQGNVKKSKKSMKTANIDRKKSSWLLNELRIFNQIFRKGVTYDNIKNHKKPVFNPLFRRYIFRKTTAVLELKKLKYSEVMLNILEFSRVWEYWLVYATNLFLIVHPYFSTTIIKRS